MEMGEDPQLLAQIATGKHAISDALKAAKNPVIILGAAALARNDGAEILESGQSDCRSLQGYP